MIKLNFFRRKKNGKTQTQPSVEERAEKITGEQWLTTVRSAIFGHAVADALGVPVEFMSRGALDVNPVTEMKGFGTYAVPAGSWSDDTSMILATLDSLKYGKIDYDGIMRNFVLWVKENKYTPTDMLFDIGGTCLRAIENYIETKNPDVCGLDDGYSNGNGSLMRILPVALYLYIKGIDTNEAIDIIHKISALTHAHPRSKVASGIFSFVLWELLRCPDKSSVEKGLRKAMTHYQGEAELSTYEHRLMKRIGRVFSDGEKAEEYPPLTREEIKSSGYVVDTLEAVIWCILTTNDYKSCVLTAVNLGEDTDTVGAIAGSLAGVLYGISSIPTDWLDTLIRREQIENLCHEAVKGWYEFP